MVAMSSRTRAALTWTSRAVQSQRAVADNCLDRNRKTVLAKSLMEMPTPNQICQNGEFPSDKSAATMETRGMLQLPPQECQRWWETESVRLRETAPQAVWSVAVRSTCGGACVRRMPYHIRPTGQPAPGRVQTGTISANCVFGVSGADGD